MSTPISTPILETLKAHHSDSYGWALACCSWETSMAEDVLQEAYLRALDGRAKYLGKSSPKTWFFSVIRRVSSDVYRIQKRHSILNLRFFGTEQVAANEPVDEDSLHQQASDHESSEQLKEALKELSQRQREVLHLVFYAEMTLDEAAQALEISLGSARTHYHRGKSRLAQLLQLKAGVQDEQ